MRKSIYTEEYRTMLAELRRLREQSAVTQEELAARLGITQSTLSKCERGENSELKLVPLKTAKSRRTVILPPGALELLKQHKAEQMIQASMLEDGWKQTGFVFTSEIGTPVEPRNLNKAFKGALKSAGLPQDIRVHDLRHSTASLMLAKGVDLKVVSDQLGHSTIRLTADTYIHTVEKTKREAAAKMQELFG